MWQGMMNAMGQNLGMGALQQDEQDFMDQNPMSMMDMVGMGGGGGSAAKGNVPPALQQHQTFGADYSNQRYKPMDNYANVGTLMSTGIFNNPVQPKEIDVRQASPSYLQSLLY